MSVWRKVVIPFAVINSAPRSDSAAKDMMNLMIVVMVRTGPLNTGEGSFYERKF